MDYEIILLNTIGCAYFDTTDELIDNEVSSATKLISNLKYECNINRVGIRREAVCDEFFDLSTGLASAILNKLIPKHYKLAIIGDFSDLEDTKFARFMKKCNGGNDIFFYPDKDTAIKRLAEAKS